MYGQSKKVTAMDEKLRQSLLSRRALLYQQIHLSVIFEDNFIQNLGRRGLLEFQDETLDEIILTERKLGLRI